jgi:hypothetical protein
MMKGKRREIKEKKRMKGRKEGQIKKRKNLKKSDTYGGIKDIFSPNL